MQARGGEFVEAEVDDGQSEMSGADSFGTVVAQDALNIEEAPNLEDISIITATKDCDSPQQQGYFDAALRSRASASLLPARGSTEGSGVSPHGYPMRSRARKALQCGECPLQREGGWSDNGFRQE